METRAVNATASEVASHFPMLSMTAVHICLPHSALSLKPSRLGATFIYLVKVCQTNLLLSHITAATPCRSSTCVLSGSSVLDQLTNTMSCISKELFIFNVTIAQLRHPKKRDLITMQPSWMQYVRADLQANRDSLDEYLTRLAIRLEHEQAHDDDI